MRDHTDISPLNIDLPLGKIIAEWAEDHAWDLNPTKGLPDGFYILEEGEDSR